MTDKQLTSHTPGPWRLKHGQGYELVLCTDEQEKIAVITDRHANYDANARLIAAAPELLEALKIAEEALWRLEPNMAAHQEVRAAIARATKA